MAAEALLLQLVVRDFVRSVFNPAFPDLGDFEVAGGADLGDAIGTRNGLRADRELLFLGSPANHAASVAGSDRRSLPRRTRRWASLRGTPQRTVSHFTPTNSLEHPVGASPRQLSFLDNDGKVVSGKDREGDEYTITVHGPGKVIVTISSSRSGRTCA